MINTNSTLIRSFLTGLFPLLMLTLLTSCQKDNPVVSKEPQLAARTLVGEYESKPVQVSKPSATNITHNSARIEWRKSRRAQEYIVTRRALYADNPESSLSPVHTTSGLSYDDTDLVPDTEFIYRIVARNNVGEAQRSSHLKFRTLPAPVGTAVSAELVVPEEEEVSEEAVPEEEEVSEEVVPEEEEVSEEVVPEEEEESRESSAAETKSDDHERKPAQVRKPSATNITHNSARIEWKQPSRAEEYIVTRRALYADHPESSLSPVHTTSGLSYDDTDLVPDTEFIYRIVARNNVGEAKRSSHLKFRTLAEPVGTVVSAELVVPEEPDEPEPEFIPEEEPLQSDAAHVVDHNTRVLNFRATAGSSTVRSWDPSRNLRTVHNTDCSPFIDLIWTPTVHPDGVQVTKHQYQIANEAVYEALVNPDTLPWVGVDHVDIPDSGDGEANFEAYKVTRYQGECLERGATYYLTIRSVFGNEFSPSAGPQIVTMWAAPEAPVLTATAGVEQIVLEWTVPEDFGRDIWGYRIFYNTEGLGPDGMGAPWEVLAVLGTPALVVENPPPTTYTHTGLTLGVTYYYWVQAANGSGIGPVSDFASATPFLECELYGLEQYGHPEFLEHEPRGYFPIRKRYSNERRGNKYNENPTNNNVTWTDDWEPTTPRAYSESAPPDFAGLDPSRCSKETSYSRFMIDGDTFRWIETEAWLCQASLCVLEQIAEEEKDDYCRQPGEICLHPDLDIKDGRPPNGPDGRRSWTEYYEYCGRPGVNCHAEYEDD